MRPPHQLQWVVDAYSVMFGGTLLLAGSLGDRFGRRRMRLAGLVVFALGSVGAALSRASSRWRSRPQAGSRSVLARGAAVNRGIASEASPARSANSPASSQAIR